jgi:invasion protein IalB
MVAGMIRPSARSAPPLISLPLVSLPGAARYLAAVLLTLALLTPESTPAVAQSPKALMKKSGYWGAYRLRERKGPACYMTSRPTKSEPKGVRRGEIWFLVTHRPKRKIHDEVSIYVGYPLEKGSDVTVVVDEAKAFTLFTDGEIAWGDGAKQEARLVKAMKKGGALTVAGVSKRGTKTKDYFSLKGFTAAYRAISKACKVK